MFCDNTPTLNSEKFVGVISRRVRRSRFASYLPGFPLILCAIQIYFFLSFNYLLLTAINSVVLEITRVTESG